MNATARLAVFQPGIVAHAAAIVVAGLTGSSCGGAAATADRGADAGDRTEQQWNAGGADFFAQPLPPDLISRDSAEAGLRLLGARVHNEGADSVPVSVQLAVQGAQLIRAHLAAYLTVGGKPANGSTTSLHVGPGAQNSVLSLLIPRPDESAPDQEYEIHVEATYTIRDGSAASRSESEHISRVTGAYPVTFGAVVSACTPVLHPQASDHSAGKCPILFSPKTHSLGDPKNRKLAASNNGELARITSVVKKLCKNRRLLAVTISGWSSATFSDAPTNEQLAKRRAETIRQTLAQSLRKDGICETRQPGGGIEELLFIDPRAGRATAAFGKAPQNNQCVQLSVHSCAKER